MQTREFNEEVLFVEDSTVRVGPDTIKLLKEKALTNKRKRVRLCSHRDVEELLHEMFIVHTKDTYVRPHKHVSRIESCHIIEGFGDIVVFDQKGNIVEVTRMGGSSTGSVFYHKLADPIYHTLIVRSDFLVFHEITNGPFRSSNTVFAPWSPEEADGSAVEEFMEGLERNIDSFFSSREARA